MFQSKPLFGVGFDSYLQSFKRFREAEYPLKYGFDITSSNAHSVPLQLLSTSGIFTFSAYVIILILIFIKSIKTIILSTGTFQKNYTMIFAAWLAYQAQSFISIDNLGLAIWGWVLGAILLSLSTSLNHLTSKEKHGVYISKLGYEKIFSYFFVVLVLFPISSLYASDRVVFETRALYQPNAKDEKFKAQFLQFATRAINKPLQDPALRIMISTYIFDMGFKSDAINILTKLYKNNPTNVESVRSLVVVYQIIGDQQKELEFRLQMQNLDPYNLANLARIASIYKADGDVIRVNELIEKIKSISKSNPVGAKLISTI